MKEDVKIIDAIRTGRKSDYLNVLYKRTLPKVKNYIRKNGGNQQDIEDIFQDAVVVFVQKVRNGTYKEGYDIDGFIYTVSRNLWINRAKVQGRTVLGEELVEPNDDKQDQLTYLISEEKTNMVHQLLASLGEACYELMKLTVLKELPLREAAEQLGYSNEGIAKTYNYRCRKKLIKLVEETPEVLQYFGR